MRIIERFRSCAVALVLAILVIALAGCGGDTGGVAGEGEQQVAAGSPEEAVARFYDSKTKHGFATFRSGSQPDERVEFWFDEDGRYRLTWYYAQEDADKIEQYGPIRIHMISPDGRAVYYARPETKLSEISYTTAEKQQWTFNGPPGWKPEAGVESDGYVVFTYAPEKLWDIEGATQQFYLHDMSVHTKDGAVEKISMRTSSKQVPESELVASEFRIEEFELDVDIADETFELPYPQ
jgi:hypothetical protein